MRVSCEHVLNYHEIMSPCKKTKMVNGPKTNLIFFNQSRIGCFFNRTFIFIKTNRLLLYYLFSIYKNRNVVLATQKKTILWIIFYEIRHLKVQELKWPKFKLK